MIGDIVKVSLLMFDNTVQFVNTFYYRDDGPINLTIDTQLFAADWLTAWVAAWSDFGMESTNCYQVNVQVIAGPGMGDVAQYVPNPVPIGTHATPGIDAQLAISIKRSNGLKGPRNRGRLFLGPVSPDYLSDMQNGKVATTNADINEIVTFVASSFTSGTSVLEPVLHGKTTGTQPNGISRSSYGLSLIKRSSRKLRFPN